jgi:hypothetical protein
MNITPHVNPNPIATAVNLQTDSLRRENDSRQIITPPTATSAAAAEKGVADKDKGKTPAQNNEQFDFTELRKKAELNDVRIGSGSEGNSNKESENDAEQNASQSSRQDEDGGEERSSETLADTRKIQQLKSRDQEVRAHELAHASVGGSTTGAPSYEFEVGPDGKKYAVGGEVSVNLSPVQGDPRATITKMEKVHAAALAPANPSAQDARVAAQAAELIVQSQAELIALGQEASEVENEPRKSSPFIGTNDVFREETKSEQQSQAFDTQISATLKAQESVVPSGDNKPQRSTDVDERALRIEGHYSTITQAYEKPSSHQFQLTA